MQRPQKRRLLYVLALLDLCLVSPASDHILSRGGSRVVPIQQHIKAARSQSATVGLPETEIALGQTERKQGKKKQKISTVVGGVGKKTRHRREQRGRNVTCSSLELAPPSRACASGCSLRPNLRGNHLNCRLLSRSPDRVTAFDLCGMAGE